MRARLRSWLLLGAGSLFLGMGIVGIVLPVMPTTPFLLLAAGCYSHSSPRLARWLEGHPRLGPPLRAWRQQGAISPAAKVLAVTTTALGYAFVWLQGEMPMTGRLALAAVLVACAVFIVSRPHPAGDAGSASPGQLPAGD
jgi:uncharacterized membrane protein YbaN (DUF454 family)